MTYYPVQPRYYVYIDSSGDPLDKGKIYFGDANKDPTLFPAKASWDRAGLYPVEFPVITSNGYPLRDGNMAQMFLNAEDNDEYSVLIEEEDGTEVFSSTDSGLSGYFPSDTAGDASTLEGHPASYFAVDSLAAHLAGAETFTGAKTFTENPKISRTSANANLSINVTTTSNLSQILFERSDAAVGKISYVHNATAANETLDFNVGGSLNTALRLYGDKTVTFYGQVNFSADFVVLRNHARVGQDGTGDSFIDFWDDNSNAYRSFKWSDSNNAWYGEDGSGTDRKFWTSGDNASVGSGVSGSFTTADAKTITVTDGIITSIV